MSIERKPPLGWTWRDWYDRHGEYLGIRSARVGPDPVQAKQHCDCRQCVGDGRQTSKVRL